MSLNEGARKVLSINRSDFGSGIRCSLLLIKKNIKLGGGCAEIVSAPLHGTLTLTAVHRGAW